MKTPFLALTATGAMCLALLTATPATANGCIGGNFPGGNGSSGDPFQVADSGDLSYLASDPNCFGYSYVQTASVTLTGTWTPIGSSANRFAGTYDGGGYAITGVTLPNADYSGLFGVTNGATLRNITVTTSTASGHADNYTGGLVGRALNTTISDVTVTADLDASSGLYLGGAVGELAGGSLTRVSVTGDIAGDTYVGGIVGRIGTAAATLTSVEATSGTVEGLQNVGGVIGGTVYGTGDGAVTITSSSSAMTIASGIQGASMGGFVGTITRVTGRVTISDSSATGGVTSTSGSVIGGFVGGAYGLFSITDCSATGNVSGANNYVGGFVAYISNPNSASVISGSSATGTVTAGGNSAGGFVGAATGGAGLITVIADSHATGNVTSTEFTGGFGGYLDRADIDDAYATGSVSGSGDVGGFAGVITDATSIDDSYATGNVTGTDLQVGGFAGWVTDYSTVTQVYAAGTVAGNERAGGLVGYLNDWAFVTRSFATGDVTGTEKVGGLVGQSGYSGSEGTVIDSYATGSASGTSYVASIMGSSEAETTLTRLYGTGAVSGTDSTPYVGGVMGLSTSDMATTATYWNTETTGQAYAGSTGSEGRTVDGTNGLTTLQMRYSTNFTGWDFTTVWGYDCDTSSSPQLRWARPAATATSCPPPPPDNGGGGGSTPSAPATTSVTPTTAPAAPPASSTPPIQQSPGTVSGTVGGQPATVTNTPQPRGQGLALALGPVTMDLRSATRTGGSVPLTTHGTLVLARTGTLPVAADGMLANSPVTVVLYSTPTTIVSGTAGADGTFIGDGRIPGTTPIGEHMLRIQGTTNDAQAFTLDIAVTVATPAAALGVSPILKVSPASARPGSTITATLTMAQVGCRAAFMLAGKRATATVAKNGLARTELTVPFIAKGKSPLTLRATVTGRGCAPVTVTAFVRTR